MRVRQRMKKRVETKEDPRRYLCELVGVHH
jgi:hypothetical protein